MKHLRWIKRFAAFLVACLLTGSALALQVVDGSDGKTKVVNVSRTEMTRIAVEGGRVRSVKYDEAELEIAQDVSAGQLFVRPRVTNKPVSIFVITGSETTHALQLQPVDMGLSSVLIQEAARERPQVADRGRRSTAIGDRAASFDSDLRRLVTTMARDETSQEYEKRMENREVPLWLGTRLLLLSSWRGLGLRGEWYRLLNEGPEPVRVVEQEFFAPDVAAVSVEIHEIAPGQHTNVFIVRREANR